MPTGRDCIAQQSSRTQSPGKGSVGSRLSGAMSTLRCSHSEPWPRGLGAWVCVSCRWLLKKGAFPGQTVQIPRCAYVPTTKGTYMCASQAFFYYCTGSAKERSSVVLTRDDAQAPSMLSICRRPQFALTCVPLPSESVRRQRAAACISRGTAEGTSANTLACPQGTCGTRRAASQRPVAEEQKPRRSSLRAGWLPFVRCGQLGRGGRTMGVGAAHAPRRQADSVSCGCSEREDL